MVKRNWSQQKPQNKRHRKGDEVPQPKRAGGDKADSGTSGAAQSRTRTRQLPRRAVVVSSHTPSLTSNSAKEGARLLQAAFEECNGGPTAACEGTLENDDENDDEEVEAVKESSTLDALEAELAELQGSADSKGVGPTGKVRQRVHVHTEVTRGVTVLACPEDKDDAKATATAPSKLVEKVFASLRSQAQEDRPDVRFVVRMVPLDVLAPPHLKNFKAAAEKQLPAMMAAAGAEEGSGWYCSFNARAMNTLSQKEVLAVLKEVLAPLKLDLSVSEADFMIVVEVNPLLCGFSVLRGFEDAFFGCNLQRAAEAAEETRQNSKG